MFQAIGTGMIPLIAVNVIAYLFEGAERGDAMGTYQILLTLAPHLRRSWEDSLDNTTIIQVYFYFYLSFQ